MHIRQTLWAIPLLGMLAVPTVTVAGYGYDDGYHDNRFEQRLDRQHQRIKEGVRSGALTRKEAKRLRRQHRHIARLEREFSRDGFLSRFERRTLRDELDAASERIYRLKHNDRYRDGYRAPRAGHGHRDHPYGWAIGLSRWDQP